MVVLYRELRSSDDSAAIPAVALTSLKGAVNTEILRGLSTQSLDEVVNCLRDTVKMFPGERRELYALADVLFHRYVQTHSPGDYEEAMVSLERILEPNQSGECPASTRDVALSHAALLAFAKSTISPKPESSEVAISRLRASLGPSSIDNGLRLQFAESLAIQAKHRFEDHGLAESREEADSRISEVVRLSSSPSLETSRKFFFELDEVRMNYSTTAIQQSIQYLEEELSDTPPGTSHQKDRLTELAKWYKIKFSHTNSISDIEESIKYSRLLLNATHSNDPWRVNSLSSLRDILFLAFENTDEISYLDESISLGYDILHLKSARDEHFHVIWELVSSLFTRSCTFGREDDMDEIFRLIPLAIDDQYPQDPVRFEFACQWAHLARRFSHPTTLSAYRTAMSLMQKFLPFAPTVSTKHSRLVAMEGFCHKMPLGYASYQIKLGQFEEAVETLEQGRTLIWSEMRGLRTPISQLGEDSPLAKRFSEINQELEALTISITPSGRPEVEDSMAQGSDYTDPFGRLVVKQRKLVEERDALVSQIQGQPGLKGFLKTPSFTTLRSAASRGPVIIINHCYHHSDIIILFHNSLPCSIPTPSDFYGR